MVIEDEKEGKYRTTSEVNSFFFATSQQLIDFQSFFKMCETGSKTSFSSGDTSNNNLSLSL